MNNFKIDLDFKEAFIKAMEYMEESEIFPEIFTPSESFLRNIPRYRGTIAGMTMLQDRIPACSQAREDSLEEGSPTKTDRLEISYISGKPDYASSILKRRRRKKNARDICFSSLTDTKLNYKHIHNYPIMINSLNDFILIDLEDMTSSTVPISTVHKTKRLKTKESTKENKTAAYTIEKEFNLFSPEYKQTDCKAEKAPVTPKRSCTKSICPRQTKKGSEQYDKGVDSVFREMNEWAVDSDLDSAKAYLMFMNHYNLIHDGKIKEHVNKVKEICKEKSNLQTTNNVIVNGNYMQYVENFHAEEEPLSNEKS